MKLRVVLAYRNGALGLAYRAGEEIELAMALAQFLLRDSPGSFSPVGDFDASERVESVDAARVVRQVADKMQKTSKVKAKDSLKGQGA